MTTIQTFETQTQGVTPTAANSAASGHAMAIAPTIGAGCTMIYDNGHPMHGTMALKMTTATATNTYADFNCDAAGVNQNIEFYFYYAAAPTAETAIAYLYAGATQIIGLFHNTTGSLRVRDFANASGLTGSNAIGAYTWVASTMYRVAVQVISGGSTTTGSCFISIYIGDNLTAVATFSANGTFNAGVTQSMTFWRIGRSGGAAGTTTYIYDDIQFASALTSGTFIGLPAGVPVANAGPDQTVSSGDLVTMAGSGTNSPTSYLWSPPGGITLSSNSAQNPTFTAPSVSTSTPYTLTMTATNASGTSTSDSIVVTVVPTFPIANAGPDQAVNVGSTVTLAGSGTQSPTSRAWTQVSGTAVTLSNNTVDAPTFTAPASPTTLVFSLIETNGAGDSSPDTVTIVVSAVTSSVNQNGAEGQTAGTTVSAANSGASGDVFGIVVIGTGDTCTYDATHPQHGALGFKLVALTGTNVYIPMSFDAANNTGNLEFYFYYTGAPTAEQAIAYLCDASGTVISLMLNATGTLRIRDKVSASPSPANSIYALTASTMYRMALQAKAGTTSTDGVIHFAVYAGDSTSPLASYDLTSANTGTAPFTRAFFGRSGASSGGSTNYYDDLQVAGGLTLAQFIGVPSAGVPATNAGGDQTDLDAGSTVTATATGTHSPTSWLWAQVSGPTVTLSSPLGPTVSFVAPSDVAGTTVVLSCTASNAAGTGTTDNVSFTILPQDQWTLHTDNTWHGSRQFAMS